MLSARFSSFKNAFVEKLENSLVVDLFFLNPLGKAKFAIEKFQ